MLKEETNEACRVEFYSSLAKYYDRIYSHIDYPSQARFIEQLFERFAQGVDKSVVDFACGTGSHLRLLTLRGFRSVGVDLSKPMLAEATRKCSAARFVQADMTTVDLCETYGLALCFFNSILYAQPLSLLQRTIGNMGRHLQHGGIAVFDVVDKSIGLNDKGREFLYDRDGTRIRFCPRWFYRGDGRILDLLVDFEIKDGDAHLSLHDHHKMSAVTIDEVCEFVRASDMEPVCLLRQFDRIQEWDRSAKSAVIIARKPLD